MQRFSERSFFLFQYFFLSPLILSFSSITFFLFFPSVIFENFSNASFCLFNILSYLQRFDFCTFTSFYIFFFSISLFSHHLIFLIVYSHPSYFQRHLFFFQMQHFSERNYFWHPLSVFHSFSIAS